MLQLLAIAPEDGVAVVRHGDRLLLVRPPYSQWALSQIEEADLERALHLQGFRADDRLLADWDSLIAHLREEIVAAHEAKGEGEPESEEIRELIHFAPPYILSSYLDRIERELLPDHEWAPAFDLLTYMLGVENVKTDPALYERTLCLLEDCRNAMEHRRRSLSISPKREIETRFQRASHQYGAAEIAHLAGLVSQRHQVIPIGG